MDYYELYAGQLKKVKSIGGDEFSALCPYHNDRNPSFNFNRSNGLSKCWSCETKMNAYQFALNRGVPNPNQYINGNNTDYRVRSSDKIVKNPYDPTDMVEYISNVNSQLIPSFICEDLIKELDIGFKDNIFVFSYKDLNDKIIGHKVHKQRTFGDAKSQWYPRQKIGSFKQKKVLYICEGEPDTLPLLSCRFQAITNTAGAGSIPKDENGRYDLDFLSKFKEIIICYDNDDSGKKGSKKLAKEIRNRHRCLPIKIIKWNDNLPQKFDVWDAFDKDETGKDFFDAVANGEYIKTSNKIGGLKLITGIEAMTKTITPRRQIIEKLIPENAQILLGGTTGANKSYMAMQLAMSLANDEDSFLDFKINVKGLKVLYLDTECGEDLLVQRYKKLMTHFSDWKGFERFNMISKEKHSLEMYDDLEQAIREFQPDVVIIDCLYNTTNGADISKNHNLFPTIDRITDIKNTYKNTIICVHHFNKGNHEQGLIIDRITGGSALQNWSEHIILLSKTNESHKRLVKIGKSRFIDYPECYYELEWDAQNEKLIMTGIQQEWKKLMIGTDKKYQWDKVLEDLPDAFSNLDFANFVEIELKKSKRTAYLWLKEMIQCNVVEKLSHSKYCKKLTLLEGE